MSEQLSSFEGIELTADDEAVITNVLTIASNPAIAGLAAPIGSLALSTTTNGRAYYKHGANNIDWVTVFTQLPNEFGSLLGQKVTLSLNDRVIIEDSEDSLNKKYTTIQEIANLVNSADSQGLDFSRRGNINPTTTLLTRDGILSSASGHPIGITSPTLESVNVSTSQVGSYTLRLFRHEGGSVNRVDIADVVATNTANLRAQAGVDFTVINPVITGVQLGVELIAGNARDIMVEVVLSGSL